MIFTEIIEKIFRSRFILINLLAFLVINLYSQTYVLNEDFSSASGTTPPLGWTNNNITGNSTDIWHFDNPGNRAPGFPIIGTFAIFDSENYSQSGGQETSNLESPSMDCSISPSILMYFDHYFIGGNGGSGKIEVYDGTNWNTAATYTDSTLGVESILLDISSYAGGVSNAKIKFQWDGDSSYFWAVDNIQIYAPLTYDAAITQIQSPIFPFAAGVHDVEVNLINSGAITMTTATIKWIINGVNQPDYSWTGSLSMGNSENNINIGNYNFPSGVPNDIKIWVEQPNGQADLYALNDTVQTTLYSSLCGVYTLGGVNPDFTSFNELNLALNNAGVTCPVTINVRDGVYDDQLLLSSVPGNSFVNTITIQGESGDSSLVKLEHSNTSTHIVFNVSYMKGLTLRDMTFDNNSGSGEVNSFLVADCDTVEISNCKFESFDSPPINAYWTSNYLKIKDSRGCVIKNNNFSDASSVRVYSNSTSKYSDFRAIGNTNIRGRYGFQYSGNGSSYLGGKILIKDNHISNCYQSFNLSAENNLNDTIRVINNVVTRDHSITSWFDWNYLLFQEFDDVVFEGNIMDNTSSIYSRYIDSIVGNRFSNVTNRSAIYVQQGSPFIANNYIHTKGQLDSKGIYVDGQNLSSKDSMVIAHNSMEIMGTGGSSSRGLHIEADVTNMTVKNNIFSAKGGGLPVHVDVPLTNLDWDYNCYYTTGNNLANFNGTNYSTVSTLGAAMGSDANSLNLNPFYLSDTNLIVGQRELNGAGIAVPGVILDIDGDLRNLAAPDVGAQEFSADYGIIDLISPTLDCFHSDSEVIEIALRQYGDAPFTNLQVAYQLNNGPVTTQTINGTIYNDIQFSFSNTEDLSIYGTYQFKFWLVNNADENVNNDTLYRTIYRDDVPVADFTTNISCANETTDFFGTGSVTSGTITGYEWIFGDGDTSVLQNPTHVYDSSGSYDVILRVYSSIGCFGDTTKAINLNTTPNADFSYSNVCLGDSMSFISLTTVDTGLVNYNWSFGDGQVSNDVDPVILYSDSGTYTTSLIASSSISGCQDTIVKNVRVNKSYNSSNYLSSMDTVVYFGIYYTNSDTVVYNFPSIDGCDSIVTTYISINASYDITLFDTICEGNSYNFNGALLSNSGIFYDTLTATDGLDSMITLNLLVNSAPIIAISSTDSFICYGDSVQLIASGAQNYSWQTSYNISSLTITNPMVYPLIDTSYVLTATDSLGCSSSDSILISVIPPYLLDLGGTIDTCIGSSFNIQATLIGGTGNNNSLIWSPSIYFNDPSLLNPIFQSDSSVMVYLDISDTIEGCQSSDSLMININNPISNAGNDLDTCYGTSLILNGSGAGVGGSYLWSPSNSLNHATIANPLAVLDSSIQFVLQISDSIGCTDNDTIQISVFSSSYLSDTSLCEGDSLNIELYVDTFYNPSFSWTPTNGLSASNTNSITIYTDSTNNYSYLATANNGCVFSDTMTVIVNNASAVIDTALLTGCEGVTMVLENISDESLNYYWIINKTDSLFEVSQEIIYDFGDRVQTDLYVENTFGCYDSTSLDFYLKGFDDYFTITEPNVFTPNGDGDNDEFIIGIPQKVQPCAELTIYNRWGQIQYFSVGYNLKWDGMNSVGSLAPAGTYFYTLNIKDKTFSGKIQLFR